MRKLNANLGFGNYEDPYYIIFLSSSFAISDIVDFLKKEKNKFISIDDILKFSRILKNKL